MSKSQPYRLKKPEIEIMRNTLADYGYSGIGKDLYIEFLNQGFTRSHQSVHRILSGNGPIDDQITSIILVLCKYDERLRFFENLSLRKKRKKISIENKLDGLESQKPAEYSFSKDDPWINLFSHLYPPA